MGGWRILHIGDENKLPAWLYKLVRHSDVYESVKGIEEGINKLKTQKFDLVIVPIEKSHDAVKKRLIDAAKASNSEVDIIYTKNIVSGGAGLGFYCNAANIENIVHNAKFLGVAETHDFLSLVEGVGMTSHIASLTIVAGDTTGVIYFKMGNIVHAETGDLKGREAFIEMVSWNGGVYFVEEGLEPPEETINVPIDSLLLEIISKMEESQNPYDKFIKVLMMELPAEVKWGAVFKGGNVVSSVGEKLNDSLVETINNFFSPFSQLIGKPTNITIEFDDYWVTVRQLVSDLFVVIGFKGNPFIVNYVLGKNLEKYGIKKFFIR